MKDKLFYIIGVATWLLVMVVAQSSNICTLCPKLIPDTQLKTRTLYKLGLKKFPSGTVTYTEGSKSTYNFVQIDNDPDNYVKYKPRGEWHYDTLWEFIPIRNTELEETGWYGLRNRGKASAYAAYETMEPSNDDPRSYHIVLEKNWTRKYIYGEYFLKPIRIDDQGRETYYQLKFKNLPNGTVTWTERKYGEKGSHYIQVDDRPDYSERYSDGGEWIEDSLFTISSKETEIVGIVEGR